MEMFRTSDGEDVDLDDLSTYKETGWTTKTIGELERLARDKLGYALLYTQHLHPDWDTAQKQRIDNFCFWFAREYANHRISNESNHLWWYKFIYRLIEETENLC